MRCKKDIRVTQCNAQREPADPRGVIRGALIALLIAALPSRAAQLHVEPVLLELDAPAAAAVLTLRNDDDSDVFVQTRVVRWSQSDDNEALDPTSDVVASPPSIKLAPHADYVVRIVRVSKQPVVGEESYRAIIDQIPTVRRQQARAVEVLIRQSIPVFFRGRDVTAPEVSWSVYRSSNRLIVTGANAGGEHLRVASLRLRAANGAAVSLGNGLAGYVLGGAKKTWTLPGGSSGFAAGGLVSVLANSDKGPVNAAVTLESRP
jgi:fimbrial chaperone protein